MRRHLPESSAPVTPDQAPPPSPRSLRRIAYEAEVCERTVLRFFAGEEVRPSSRERIERTLAALARDGEERRK